MSMATLRAGRAQEPLQVGDPLPALKGQLLTGRDAALPQAASGKVALVAIGFTYQVPRSGRSVGGLAPQEVRLEDGRDVVRGADDWRAGNARPVVHRPGNAQAAPLSNSTTTSSRSMEAPASGSNGSPILRSTKTMPT